LSPGTGMKQGPAVHFVAGLFQAIAPDAQRMRRETECCGVLNVLHAAPVHRLQCMRQNARSAIGPLSLRTLWRLRRGLFGRFGGRFFRYRSGFFRHNFCRSSARLRRSSAQQMARPPHQTCRRKIVLPAVMLRFQRASIPGRNMVRSERVVGLCPGTSRRHRRVSSAAGEPESPNWNENKISDRRAGFGRLPRKGTDCKIKRVSRFRNFVPKFLSAHCFRSICGVPSRSASGAFSDLRSLSTLQEPSPAIGCKSEMAVSSPAQVFPRCITRTAFLALRNHVRLPIVV
jgi:hypothetical protein